MSTIPDFVKHAKEGMQKAVENAKKELILLSFTRVFRPSLMT